MAYLHENIKAGSKFGKTGDVLCQFHPEISQIVSWWALESFIAWEPRLVFLEDDKRVDHSSVNSIEKKNRFPPCHAFMVH